MTGESFCRLGPPRGLKITNYDGNDVIAMLGYTLEIRAWMINAVCHVCGGSTGAMNRTCSVLLKIRTCRKLDAECYYAVIPFFSRSGRRFCIHFGSSVAALVLVALDFCGHDLDENL